MPATSTIPEELKLLLAQFKTNLTAFSRHTGISRTRLIAAFQAGDFTRPELLKLVQLLRPDFARAFICGSQLGVNNQAGTANRQKVITKTTYNIVINVTNASEPRPRSIIRIPQQPNRYLLLPGGQAQGVEERGGFGGRGF
jgi:hypothetical protein